MIITILAVKIGDSLLCNEDGSLQPIIPDLFYPKGMKAYWMLKRIENNWKILRAVYPNNDDIDA